ncbi:MAG: CPXCG motif-containing cysteine-rich protein [Deltaproteobacteria bacterium]|nr:CPXCG motif-containing cysteine-rich protein [Deltaproteobacteria bacterium]
MEDPIDVICPWCGESFTTFFDSSVGAQRYTEDCQVCCRPIDLNFRELSDGSFTCDTERTF